MSAPTVRPPGLRDVADLTFAVTGVRALEHAAVPTLAFALEIRRTGGGPVRAVSLGADVRIAAPRRRHTPAERVALARLFGGPEQWATGLRPLSWARLSVTVPPFDDVTLIDLSVPCTRECEEAVTAYFDAVRDGEV
ncbi:DUF6084 family protein, partial [Streptomyces sp. NPDC049577]|uniref:DUF6084 family protein n=1 Tax=Streptomyces sp. NPDC049577 TaxID=3155153 RepID=UPI003439FACA